MNKKRIPFAAMTSAAVITSFVAAPLAPLAEVQPENTSSDFTLSLMHTNDTHAKTETAPKRITAIKEIRAEKPDAVLVDAGDVFTGTLYFNEFQGQADLEFMNLAGYDVMTFGNHEFDLGSSPEGHKALADFIKGAQFPFVSTNVDFSADTNLQGLFSDVISSEPENGKIYNGMVKEINGEKVGFFGLTTAETAGLSSPKAVTFEDYKAEAQKAVAAFEGMGVNKIVAVSHIGYDDDPKIDNDLTLASEVDGIDVIVGGHSHTSLDQPKVVDKDKNGTAKDPTVIVQASSQGDYLGTVDVNFDENGKVTGQAGSLLKVADYEADLEAAEVLKKYKPQVDETAKEEIGVTTQATLENPRTDGDNTKQSVRKNETPLGNLITDGMLKKAKEINSDVIMAFQNGGGIRSSIDAGPITVGEVITVLPFGNTLSLMDITGAELKQAFEISFGKYPLENGGFLHVSGAKIEFDSSKPAGERVVSISYKNTDGTYTEVNDGETYTVATNAFTAKGGDSYTVFGDIYKDGRVTDLGLSDWENFAEHLQSLDSITPTVEDRIVDVVGQEQPAVEAPPFFQYQGENLKVNQIAQYDSGAGEGGTEILAYDEGLKRAFVTNGAKDGMDILSFDKLKSGKFTSIKSWKHIALKDFGIENVADITSVASHPTKDIVALSVVSDPKTDPGYVVLLTKDGKFINKVQVGALPDMVTFTPDGTKLLSANEGEPSDDYSVDPEGTISIMDVTGDLKKVTAKTLTFKDVELDESVRVSSKGTTLQQLEPEYITVSKDSKKAYVSLQENNAIATLDLENNTIIDVKGLGIKDYSIPGNELDGKRNGKTEIEKLPLLGFYMPDAIDTFTVGDKNYILTPNEGDSRDYEAYSEETSIGDIADQIQLNADHYEGYTQEELDQLVKDGLLDELKKTTVTKENGKNQDGKYDALYAFGGRSFSIFDADTMKLVFDSGSEFEKITSDALPEYFNTTNDEISYDKRSSAKGPEPETVVTGVIDDVKYAFIALERTSGIMVYDLTNPESPEFVTLISSRDYSEDVKGDVSPEGLRFIPAEASPTGYPLLAATHEVSGTVAVYEFGGKEIVEEKPFTFEDVDKSNWAYDYINNLYQHDIIKGVSETSFAPDKSVSRAEFAAMLGRAFNIVTASSTTTSPFTDVPDWAAQEVQALYEAGIVKGIGQGLFDSNTEISREYMALMIVRAYEYTTGSTIAVENEKIYNDQSLISPQTMEAVQKLYQTGVMEGKPNNQFAPQSLSSRAEAAKVVSVLMDKVK